MQHNINNVEALWPRINKTYKFDSAEKRSVPCPASDPMAAYEMSFRMTAQQAKELWAKMLEAYNAKKETGWPDQPTSPFKKEDNGCFIAKAKLKGSYNGEPTKGVQQYDAQGNKLVNDFMLTTGSKVNVAVTFVPYNMREAGVSMRLRAVQVVEYREMEEQNPFAQVDGFTANDANSNPFGAPSTPAPSDDPFGLPEVKPAAPAATPEPLDDEIPW
jgi:hypothetical protein